MPGKANPNTTEHNTSTNENRKKLNHRMNHRNILTQWWPMVKHTLKPQFKII